MTNQIQNQTPEARNKTGRPLLPVSVIRSFGHSVVDSSFGFRISGFRPRGSARHSDVELRLALRAFTLIELMISLAMVLILILGINFVFRSATDAVGAGQALNGINSDAQSAQPVLFGDFQNVSKNPPCFIISSQLVTQFLNSDDAKTGSDPTIIITDNNGGTTAGGKVTIGNGGAATAGYLSPALLNSRNHRCDILQFFAHGLYQRRSGNDGTYFGPESAQDAYIEIGHAALPTNGLTAFYGPSSLPNATTGVYNGATVTGVPRIGAYASDWVLARRVTLLKDPASITTANEVYYSNAGTPVQSTGTNFSLNMAPLSYGSLDNNSTPALRTQFQSSRYDLAGVTPENFDRNQIVAALLGWQDGGAYGGTSLWWNPLVYSFQMNQTQKQPPATYPNEVPYLTSQNNVYFFNAPFNYTGVPTLATTDPGLWYNRPQCNPTVQSPVTAATLAQMAPYFLQHCSQFIVEYAGDYMQQDANGNMTGIGPDGQIDFYLDAQGNKHIRWYGMPRSSTGVPHPSDSTAGKTLVLIRGFNGKNIGAGGTEDPTANGALNYFTDVIPLRDYYSMFRDVGGAEWISSPAWEPDVNFDPCGDYGAYAAPIPPTTSNGFQTGMGSTGNYFNNPLNPPRYVAAWHDDMPAMIRIIVKVDDPNNKVKDGPWYEYVFKLK
jgi:prepilin-type N-terminal cleavage/methylation domain-containing protein